MAPYNSDMEREWNRRLVGSRAPVNPARSSIWNKVGAELNMIRNSPMGQMVGAGVNAATNLASKPLEAVGQMTESYGKFTGSPWLEKMGADSAQFWNGPPAVPKVGPVVRSQEPRAPEQVGMNGSPDDMGNPSPVNYSPGQAMVEPGDQNRFSGMQGTPSGPTFNMKSEANTPAGMRGVNRYLEMARAVPEDTQAAFDKIGGVETIRGTTRGYFDPRTTQEYGTMREAVAGRTGDVGAKEMLGTEKDYLDRQADSRTAALQSSLGYQGRVDAVKEAAKAGGGAGGDKINRFKHIEALTDLSGNVTQPAYAFDTMTGQPVDLSGALPKDYVEAYAGAAKKDPVSAGYSIMQIPDEKIRLKLLEALPEEERNAIIKNEKSILAKYFGERK